MRNGAFRPATHLLHAATGRSARHRPDPTPLEPGGNRLHRVKPLHPLITNDLQPATLLLATQRRPSLNRGNAGLNDPTPLGLKNTPRETPTTTYCVWFIGPLKHRNRGSWKASPCLALSQTFEAGVKYPGQARVIQSRVSPPVGLDERSAFCRRQSLQQARRGQPQPNPELPADGRRMTQIKRTRLNRRTRRAQSFFLCSLRDLPFPNSSSAWIGPVICGQRPFLCQINITPCLCVLIQHCPRITRIPRMGMPIQILYS
jgi:hypothetical protein